MFCCTKLVYNAEGVATMMIDTMRLISIFGMTYRQISSYQDYLLEVRMCNSLINKSNHPGKPGKLIL